MINIAICDDCNKHNKIISDYCGEHQNESKPEFRITVFNSGEALIQHYKAGRNKFDIIFLDVDMGEGTLNGIETAKILRENYDRNFHVIFLSAYPEYMQKTFYVGASNFLIKPITYEAFKEELLRIIAIMNTSASASNNSYLVRTIADTNMDANDFVLDLDKVLYFQTRKGKIRKTETIVVMENSKEPLIITKTIGKISNDLKDRGFYVIMRATLVNLNRINSFIVNTNMLKMDNGDILSYRRGTLKTLKTVYNKARLLKW